LKVSKPPTNGAPSGPSLFGLLGAKPKEPELPKTATKPKPGTPPARKFHLDKRAETILAAAVEEDDDDMLTTVETALWLQVSPQWLAIGRHRGYGPKFKRYSTLVVRYRRADVRAWLRERTFASTAEYDAKKKAEA
jgi:hypothetical protein